MGSTDKFKYSSGLLTKIDADTSEATANSHSIFFALNPETEAEQASEFMSSATSRTKRPLVLAANTPGSQRMVERCEESWSGINEPSVSLFSQRDDMKSAVEASLGLVGSKERIRAVKTAAGKIIVDEQERSRRDISGIYLPGNLTSSSVKTFIDVITFAERIPVLEPRLHTSLRINLATTISTVLYFLKHLG